MSEIVRGRRQERIKLFDQIAPTQQRNIHSRPATTKILMVILKQESSAVYESAYYQVREERAKKV